MLNYDTTGAAANWGSRFAPCCRTSALAENTVTFWWYTLLMVAPWLRAPSIRQLPRRSACISPTMMPCYGTPWPRSKGVVRSL